MKTTFCTYLVAMKVDFFLALFFSLLLGMLIGADKKVGFWQAIDDEEYAFPYFRSGIKYCTS